MHTRILRCTLLAALGLRLVYAQIDVGRIVGTVSDATGAAVPDAVITIVNEKTRQERKVVADHAGFYVAPNLVPSTYKISAKATSLGPTDFAGIPLSVGQERVLNITLRPAT